MKLPCKIGINPQTIIHCVRTSIYWILTPPICFPFRNLSTENGRRVRNGRPVQIWKLCVGHKSCLAESSQIPRAGEYLSLNWSFALAKYTSRLLHRAMAWFKATAEVMHLVNGRDGSRKPVWPLIYYTSWTIIAPLQFAQKNWRRWNRRRSNRRRSKMNVTLILRMLPLKTLPNGKVGLSVLVLKTSKQEWPRTSDLIKGHWMGGFLFSISNDDHRWDILANRIESSPGISIDEVLFRTMKMLFI